MAETQPLTPTDAEIVALADATRTAEGGANGYILPISFARAVLAMWGTPAPVVAEPVAETLADHESGETGYCDFFKALQNGTKLYTAQPVERGPLPVSQIRDWWASENGLEDCEMCKLTDFLRVVRAVEEKHGIKGGQHGAE